MTDAYDGMLARVSSLDGSAQRDETAVLEPFTYATSKKGKELRARIIDAFNAWLDVPVEKLETIGRIVSMLHNASLLIDDIEDVSDLRRGASVACKKFGVPQTINAAHYVTFLAYRELFSLVPATRSETSPAISKSDRLITAKGLELILTGELLNLQRGQGLDLVWRDSLRCPTEEEYISMVNNKTGGLFRTAVRLLMACASTNTDVDYIPLINLIAIYLQIRDDYMNLESTDYLESTCFADDLSEGKFSFPIVHAVHADTSNRQVLDMLEKRPATPSIKQCMIEYLRENTRSLEYTLDVMSKLETQAREEIARLGGNFWLEAILDAMHVARGGAKL